jgi:hypothetical protein
LYVNAATATVRISRLHFKGGRATNNGAAIRNTGILTLESCIFSDNRTSAYGACGGALYTTGNTIVSGCTFYGNTTGVYGTSRGGAIYSESGTVNLAGNVFWGNTALEGSVAYGSVTSGGFNVSDKTSGTDTALGSGWTFESTDAQAVSLPVSSVSFRPIGGGIALNRISARPPAYPEVDFYGVDIPETNAAAGAAQTATTGTGYFLDYVPRGPGTVSVTSGTVDFDGFASAVVELTAADKANGTFRYWIVNGTQHTETSNVLALNVDNDTTVQAVFFTVVSSIDDSGPGSLREALTGVIDGGGIVLPASQTITLNTPLLQITKSLVIEGNGATLTQSGFAENSTSQLLIINNNTAEVHISRLHFKGGRTNNYGAGIKTTAGILTLESCIFSDNKASDTQGFGGGGAIYTYGNLTVSGCTFYGNSSTSSGGAIYRQYGTVTLTGNIFWGNTAFQHNVVYSSAGSVISHGYNISDKADGSNATLGSGWTFEAADMQTSMPISPLSFKPIKDGEALNVIPTIPADYPVLDFYGVAIPTEQAASGAIQTATATTGYILDYAPIGPGTINVTGLTLDDDGLISNDSVIILTAQADGNGIFGHWTVDGVKEEAQTPPNALSVIMNDHKTVRAVFYTVVTSSADSGPGSLREALTGVMDGGGIVLPAGQTITLNAPLPAITKSLVIEGNGTTLTQSNFATSATSQLLYINSTTAEVRINRLHFKGGRATNSGAAIFNNGGRLTLESCIFSNNKTSANNAYGGAIYTFGATAFITVSGCAFYGNSAGTAGASQGGAIYCNGGTVNLTGNVFWANTAVQHNVVYGSVISGGFNVSDKADGSDAVLGSGWTFTATDSQAPSLPISPLSFKAIKGSDDLNVITTIPVNYPTVDFYGTAIPAENAAAGAAQTATAGTGYFLDYAFIGPGAVYDGGTMDDDGLRANGSKAILTAQAASDGIFMYWTVDGIKESEQSPQLTVTMDDHKIVQAVFYFAVTNIGNSGPGSLREVLGSMVDGDVILLPAGQTITLNTPLPTITKSIIIEGNGATLIQNGFTESPTSQLLFITSGKLHISRLHFKGGRATNYGAAIRSTGTLTLESCIFSNNRTSASNAQGGAIFISGNAAALIVSGCTFHGNSAGSANTTRGGAIFGSAGTVTLTGNVFWENTAVQGNVMYGNASITSKGHNVSDKASGTTSDASGWNFINSDAQLSGLSFDADFKPSHESLPAIPSPPVGDPGLFPLCYFDGTIRGTAPGAMPSQ